MGEHPMRRKDRLMPEGEALALLEKGEYGVLSTVGPDGAPYGIPLSYVVVDGAVYFHCAMLGRKIDNLTHESRVSFCVCGGAEVFFGSDFTTAYESVILSGRAIPVEDREKKSRALSALCVKYLPNHADKIEASLTASMDRTGVYRIDIEAISGKRNATKV